MKTLNQDNYKNDYNKGKLKQPNWNEEKDDAFFLKYAQWIWGQYLGGVCGVLPDGVVYNKSISTLRAYGRGMQSPQVYQDYLDPVDKKGERLMNISWDTEKILPNLRAAIKEMVHEINLEPDIEAVDERSKSRKKRQITYMKTLTDPKIKAMVQNVGIDPAELLPEGASSEFDIDFIDKMGGFKLIEEMEIKDMIDKTLERGGWDALKDMIADDLVDGHTIAIHMRNIGTALIPEYVDIAKIIARRSKYLDYRDSDYMGFWQSVTLSELREMGVDEEKLTLIAKKYAGTNKSEHLNWDTTYRENYLRQNGNLWYDGFTIDVMTCYFLCKDAEKYIVGRHRDGNEIYDKVKRDSKLDDKDIKRGKRFEEQVSTKMYQVNWVIGTDCVFLSGENTNNVLDENNTPLMPIIMVTGDGPSPVEKAISLVDDIHLALYKMRHVLSKLPPGPRMMFDKSKMRNGVSFGQEQFSMKEMLEMYPKTGVFFYETIADWSDQSLGGQSNPIQFLPSGIGEDIQILGQEIMTKTERLRTVMGVNALMDGSSRQPNMLKGVMEGLVSSANTINRPYSRLMMTFFRRVVSFIGNYWRNAIVYGEDSGFPPEVLERLNKSQYRYEVKFGMNEMDRELMLQDLIAKRDQALVTPDAFIVIYNMIKRGDIAKAQLYYVKAVREAEEKAHARQKELIEVQAQGNQQAGQAVEEARIANEREIHGMTIDKIAKQADADIRVYQETKGTEIENNI
jgi:hypothetical protein